MDALLEVVREWGWVLLLSVGILEVVILISIFREKKERDKLVREMQTTRIELGRGSYLAMIKDALGKSVNYVYFISHSLTLTMTEDQKHSIYRLYRKGVDHRCLTGKDPSKIRYMWEQRRAGVQVHVSDLVTASTFRFQVSDDKFAILGFADEGNQESRKGILITNPYFCRMLRQHFLRVWEESLPLEDYVKVTMSTLSGPELGLSLDELAVEWGLNEEEKTYLRRIIGNSHG